MNKYNDLLKSSLSLGNFFKFELSKDIMILIFKFTIVKLNNFVKYSRNTI
jgi:hypothetical protein